MVQLIKSQVRVITAAPAIITAAMVCDFLLLVTSLGFHWWRPWWGAAVSRVMLVFLVFLSTASTAGRRIRKWVRSACGVAGL